jgi:hypothetical protein
MPKILTDEERKERNRRRIDQRERAKQREKDQWALFGLDKRSDRFMLYGRSFRYETDALVTNDAGKVCIKAWDTKQGDEYNKPPIILLTVEQMKNATQKIKC